MQSWCWSLSPGSADSRAHTGSQRPPSLPLRVFSLLAAYPAVVANDRRWRCLSALELLGVVVAYDHMMLSFQCRVVLERNN